MNNRGKLNKFKNESYDTLKMQKGQNNKDNVQTLKRKDILSAEDQSRKKRVSGLF